MNIKKIVRYAALGALFLIPVFPLLVANSYFFPFITGKAFYFRILVEIAFAAWFILAALDAKYRPRFSWLTIGVTVFALITLIADLLGVAPVRSIMSNYERMEGWLTIIHLWMFFIASVSLFGHTEEGKKNWHDWFNISLFIALIVAIYGFVQLFGGAAIHQGSSRIDASLGNSAYMAIYMLLHAFIAAYMFTVARANKIKFANALVWAYPVLAAVFGFLVFMTQTRGSILGVIGGIMLSLFLYAVFAPKADRKSKYISAGILGVVVILGIVFWINKDQAFIQRNPILGRLATISWSEASSQARQQIWPMALKGSMQRPVLGWGQENFNYIFNANYNPVMYAQEQWFDRAHSVFLDWLVASGILGLLAYLSLYVLFLVSVWKSDLSVAQKSIWTGFLAGYFVHNIFVFDNLASYVTFFAALGYAFSLRESRHFKFVGNKAMRPDMVEYVVAPAVIILLAAGLYFVNVKAMQANTRLITALTNCGSKPDVADFEKALKVGSSMGNQEIREQLLNCSARTIVSPYVPAATRKAFFDLTTVEIQNQLKASPEDARGYALSGSFLNSIGDYESALPILEKAHELSPKKQTIDFDLATAYINTKQADKAEKLMKEAYESEKNYYQAKAAYVMTLILGNKEAEARKLFANEPDLFVTEQVAQAFVSRNEIQKGIAIYRELIKRNPKDINLRAALSEIQFRANMKAASIETLKQAQADFPDYRDQIGQTIKQIQQ